MEWAELAKLKRMDAFVIYGNQNVGKTTACYKLYEHLLQLSAIVLNSVPQVIIDPLVSRVDFSVMLDYKGKKILITSAGDDAATIANNINLAIFSRPDYFIFAIRSGSRYKSSLAYLQNTVNCSSRFFHLPIPQDKTIQNNNELQVVNTILSLI